MRICSVVDTSINEDRIYLEFWCKGKVYASSFNNYIYVVQDYSLEEWTQENIELKCPYVLKPQ